MTDYPYPDELYEEAENQAIEALDTLMEDHEGAMKQIAEIEKNELIDQAIEELGWIASGGQDLREFANSIKFIKDVLEQLKQ
jgi:hypothetical protein